MDADFANRNEFIQVRRAVWLALQQFFMRDSYLLESDVHEGDVSHRIAVYLEQSFPLWHVDCEFNRDGQDVKRTSEASMGFRPDIIVHRRGRSGPNLLAVEIKKSSEINDGDRKKLEGILSEYGYSWGVCISMCSDGAILEWQGCEIAEPKLNELRWASVEETGHVE
ncbi:MAG: hypothetical protein M0R22_03960 [Dehalococcoidia bacterium]|jgi:hypothetical protein|nr:hypothetical protein [Dehalococcoidia bacterium]